MTADASPFARLRRLAEHASLYGRCLSNSDILELNRLLDYAEKAHAFGRHFDPRADTGASRVGERAHADWLAFKAADAALGEVRVAGDNGT